MSDSVRDDCCDPAGAIDRRGFVRLSVAGYLGLALGARSAFADGPAKSPPKGSGKAAQSCIVLWLNGAPSQFETFDPKPGVAEGGPTKAIETAVKGIFLAETLPRLAEQMKHVSLVRSMSTKEGNHQRARYYLHTGYVPSGTVQHPDFGSLICQQRADADNELPPYVAISGATPGPGILGVKLAPFTVQDPNKPVANIAYAAGIDQKGFARRRELLDRLARGFVKEHPGPETEGHAAVYARADKLMHSARVKAFDLTGESAKLREAYGTTPFGTGCLMARRLVEQGVKVVEVQLNGWDTHKDNFERTKKLGEQLDMGFATLIEDLKQRDLLEKTLIVCMGEFGRTPRINQPDKMPGRQHWPNCWTAILAGGGTRGGRVVGETDRIAAYVKDRPVRVQDLGATIYHSLGIAPETRLGRDGFTRPVTSGTPLLELF